MRLKSPHGRIIENTDGKILVMGILNVTPDSFSDGGAHLSPKDALKHAEGLVAQGADIIDIGAESTRPNSEKISAEAEISRLTPALEAVRKEFPDTPISVDTYKPSVAKSAIENGADIINDVMAARYGFAGGHSPMAVLAANLSAPIILMHNCFETPIPQSADIVGKVAKSLAESADMCIKAGVQKSQIVLDIGFGFGKSNAQNLELLRRLKEFEKLDYPMLLGLSRKRTIGAICQEPSPSLRDDATAFANLYAAMQKSADIIRVHNVEKNVVALKTLRAINSPQEWTL